MTLPNNTAPTASYVGNGTAKNFPFTFRPLSNNNIKVTVYDVDGDPTILQYGVDYNAAFAPFPNAGGEVLLLDADQLWLNGTGKLNTGWSIFIEYVPVLSQDRRFRDFGPRSPLEIEKMIDQMTMDLKSVDERVGRALTIPGAGSGDVDSELPPLIGNARKILRVSDDETGYVLGPDVDSIFTAMADAETAADASAASAVDANASKIAAATSATLAQNQVALATTQVSLATGQAANAAASAITAANQVPLAAAQVALAVTAASVSQDWSELSQQYAESTLYGDVVELDSSIDSPYVITVGDFNTVFNVSALTEDMVFVLPNMNTLPVDFKFAAVKRESSAHELIFNSNIVDTINGQPAISIDQEAYGVAVHAMIPGTDWRARFFLLEASGAGGGGAGGGISEWEAAKLYTAGDVVHYQGQIYLCETTHTSTVSFDDDYTAGDWSQLAQPLNVEADLADLQDAFDAHAADMNNPHGVTKAQVGLANADNTSDANKPISTATQTALNLKADAAAVATALAAKENTITATTAADYYRGDKTFQPLNKAAVGLSNVDNTSDANKPVSTAQQTALNLKQNSLPAGTDGQILSLVSGNPAWVANSGGGGTADLAPGAMFQQTFETATLANFTQTGLSLLSTPANILIKGTKVAQLIHQSGVSQSFKQVIAVDNDFRNKQMTFSVDVRSTASQGNLTIAFNDESNSGAAIGASQAFTTGSQAISVTTTNASAVLSGLTTALINTLSIGMSVTGAGIATNSTISSINYTALTVTLSANATASATITARFSALPAGNSFAVTVPANCSSISYTITALAEANTPVSFVDNIYFQIATMARTSAAIVIPKNNDTDYVNKGTITIGAVTTAPTKGTTTVDRVMVKRKGSNALMWYQYTQTTAGGSAGSGNYLFSLPVGMSFDLSVVIPFTGAPWGAGQTMANAFVGEGSYNNAAGFGPARAYAYSATQFRVIAEYGGSGAATAHYLVGSVDFAMNTTNLSFELHLDAPISGWLSNETETKSISLTSSILTTQPDSCIRLNTANGFGSTNAVIRRFGNLESSIGSDILYTDSPTLGASFTALTDGFYAISYTDNFNGVSNLGLSLNTTQATTDIAVLTPPDRLEYTTTAAVNNAGNVSWSGPLKAGDVIRPHTSGVAAGISARVNFSMSKAGSVKQLNASSDQKIDIPTHALRFEGASTRGSTDTGIVKFNTMTNIVGDAWDVVNTAANGTVVTIKKKGTLTVGVSLLFTVASGQPQITKNQTVLTGPSSVSSEVIAGEYTSGSSDLLSLSATFLVNVGDKIRVASGTTPASDPVNSMNFFLQENSVQVALSNVLPQFTQGDSSVRVNTSNGYGSTGNKIKRFSNVSENAGSAISYVDSATNGASFTVNEDGLYSISYTDQATGSMFFGVSKNSSELTTAIHTINFADKIGFTTSVSVSSYPSTFAWTGYLLKNDVIRPHTDGGASSASTSYSSFTISKVGKPNITSVDVTPFVNIKTQEIQSSFLSSSTGFTANITGPLASNTSTGIFTYDATTGIYTVLKKAMIHMSATINGTSAVFTQIFKNTTMVSAAYSVNSAGYYACNSVPFEAIAGDTFYVKIVSGTSTANIVSVVATAASDTVATQLNQVSSDTMALNFKATTIVDADPIGTYNTYTYALNSNTMTISATAPTQTTASMNSNGILVTGRAWNSASTSATPARFVIKIGAGLTDYAAVGYSGTGKSSSIIYALQSWATNAALTGVVTGYDKTTGLLTLDAGYDISGASSTRYVGYDTTTRSAAYFTFNAATTPQIAAFPNLLGTRLNTTSGYWKAPNGMIYQWGEYTSSMTHTTSYSPTFPIAFPTAVLQVITTVGASTLSTATGIIGIPLTAKSTTGFTFQYGASSGTTSTTTVAYFAIGY